MTDEERSISIAEAIEIAGYTHIQIVCCKAVMKPLATLPPAAQQLLLDALSPCLRCSSCGRPASPSRVAFWKHGMRQLR